MRGLIRFLVKHAYVFLFLLLEGFAFLFIGSNSFHQGRKILAVANGVSGNINTIRDDIVQYFSLRTINEQLAKENAGLREQIEQSYVRFTHKSFTIDDTVYKQQYEYIDAKVLSNTVNRRNNYMMLNKGSAHHVQKDMAVIAPSGIVGVVVNVSRNFSIVMTVLHKDSRKSVRIKRTGLAGYLIWEGGNYTEGVLVDIPASIPLVKGDTVITSGFSQDTPEGIVVGYVDSFEEDGGTGFYRVKIKFATDYNKLDYVYVVRNLFKEEQDKLIKEQENEE